MQFQIQSRTSDETDPMRATLTLADYKLRLFAAAFLPRFLCAHNVQSRNMLQKSTRFTVLHLTDKT
jgi:hypothetical protein